MYPSVSLPTIFRFNTTSNTPCRILVLLFLSFVLRSPIRELSFSYAPLEEKRMASLGDKGKVLIQNNIEDN